MLIAQASAPVDWDNVDAKIEEAVVETPVEALNSMSLSAGGGVAGLAKVAAGGDKKTGATQHAQPRHRAPHSVPMPVLLVKVENLQRLCRWLDVSTRAGHCP